MRKVGGRKKEKHLDEVLGDFGKRIYKTRLPNEPTTEPTTERSGSLTAGNSRGTLLFRQACRNGLGRCQTEAVFFPFSNDDCLFSFCVLSLFLAVVMDLTSRNLSVHPSFP